MIFPEESKGEKVRIEKEGRRNDKKKKGIAPNYNSKMTTQIRYTLQ